MSEIETYGIRCVTAAAFSSSADGNDSSGIPLSAHLWVHPFIWGTRWSDVGANLQTVPLERPERIVSLQRSDCKVTVAGLQGEVLEADLPGSATIGYLKGEIE